VVLAQVAKEAQGIEIVSLNTLRHKRYCLLTVFN